MEGKQDQEQDEEQGVCAHIWLQRDRRHIEARSISGQTGVGVMLGGMPHLQHTEGFTREPHPGDSSVATALPDYAYE